MWKFNFLFYAITIVILLITGCQSNSVAPVMDNHSSTITLKKSVVVQSVSGSGNYSIDGDLRVFNFKADRYNDGSVSGHFDLNRHGTNVRYSGLITVFSVVGNIVYWGGFITSSNQTTPDLSVGAGAISAAIDNGQGKNNPPDQVTLIATDHTLSQANLDQYCNVDRYFVSPPVDVQKGGIVIH